MKLLLQPLVENAVYHGLEPKTGTGTVYIGARLENNDLLISIYDDGVGIPPDRLTALQADLERPVASSRGGNAHIGLLNVQNRIRLRYGESLWSILAKYIRKWHPDYRSYTCK